MVDQKILKSRDISLSDLYSNLQLEYISYFMRAKTYCKEFAVNYREICLIKKEKIEKISSKNNLPSIFNDCHSKQRYIDRFLNLKGVPNFTYKDEAIKAKMGCWDKHYFFQKGSSIKFTAGCDVLIGQITKNDKDSCIVEVVDENKATRELHYNNITRIFSEDFFTF